MAEFLEAEGIAPPKLRCRLNNLDEITYTITHNIFKKTLKKDFYLQLELALYDKYGRYLETIKFNETQEKYPQFSSVFNIYDK